MKINGVSSDMTRHNQIERSLRESEERYRTLAESSLTGVYLIQEGRFRYVNPALASIFGYTVAEITDTLGPLDLTVPEDRLIAAENIRRRIDGEIQEIRYALRGLRKNGEIIYVEVHGRRLDYLGKPAVMGTLIDITERERAQKALRDSEERFRTLTETTSSIILIYQGEHMRYVNRAAEALLGYTRQEILAKTFWDVIYPDDQEMIRQRGLARQRGENVPPNIQVRVVTKHGEIRWVDFTAAMVEFEGKPAVLGTAFDITRRKQAEDAMRLQSTALNAAANAIVITDQDGTIQSVNPAFTTLTGYTASEAIGKNPRDLVKSGVQDTEFYRTMWKTLLANKVWRGEIVNRKKDGSLYTEDQTITPVTGGNGVITNFIAIKEDVTDRKNAEQTVRESESRLSAFLEATLDGVVVEHDDRVVFANKAFAKMYGYADPAELAGKHISELQSDEDIVRMTEYARRRERGESAPTRYEFRGKHKDGSLIDLEVSVSVFQIAGKFHIISIVRDISDRKLAEKQIREQAELLDNASDGILVRNLENQILFWNKGAERMYGWRRDEVLGRTVSEFLYPDSTDKFPELRKEILNSGDWEGEVEHKTKSGEIITVRTHWTLMRDQGGNPQSILSVNTDITEKKSFEAHVLRTQRLESLGTLAGGIAHDLNNVLAPILLSFEAIKRKISGDQRTLQLLSVAEASATRGKNIIAQILTFARGIEGAQGPIQLKHLLGECEQIIKETFPKSIMLEAAIPKNLWPISGDATQIHQVLMNLCVNARDAMPQGGTMRLAASNLHLDQEFVSMRVGAQTGPHVLLEVSDTGVGIPKENLDRIFDPFFTTKEVGKGTGLGLSTIHTIVRGHGGFVDVNSRVGLGTTFRVYLPATAGAGQEDAGRPEERFPQGNGEMILIVDDEASIRDITSETLQMFNYRIVTAENGVEAVAQLAKYKDELDLVLMDLMMPVMDGPAAMRAMRRIKPDIRIIASSGIVPGEGSGESDIDVQAFLEKPYAAERLLNVIHGVLTKHK
ncbi:MAG: PAS domain S-box protein [Ignavibacteriales bacterium]|nr:PAS domain S-box protein [Ignavibacteriales bacterium]